MLNANVRKLERICKGKIPNANDIKKLINEYDEGFAITKQMMLEQSQQTNVNPVKCMWEAEGIKFPGRGILQTVATHLQVPGEPLHLELSQCYTMMLLWLWL